ncbi:MAG: arginine--tRNA ligase, partial [Candidatus Methanomethylophilaceae archaeon]|nr:arginine--tRNA ligase [Candidatus Methanomethylophilaceae archaeon]
MGIADDFRNDVEIATRNALAESGSEAEFIIEVPSVGDADLAVPCFSLAKSMRRSPKDIAEKLAGMIRPSGSISAVSSLNG